MIKSLRDCAAKDDYVLPKGTADSDLPLLLKCLSYRKNLRYFKCLAANLNLSGRQLNSIFSCHSNLVEIQMPCCELTYMCLKQIERFPDLLTLLNLNYNYFGNEGEEELKRLLEPLQNLQILSLRSCDLNCQYEFDLKYLREIDISFNPLDGVGAINFVQKKLVSLNLSHTQSDQKSLLDRILLKCSLMPFLETLELASCSITPSDVGNILSKISRLKKLDLSHNTALTFTTLIMILKGSKSLEYLDMSKCETIKKTPVRGLALKNPQKFTLFITKLSSHGKNYGRGQVQRSCCLTRSCSLSAELKIFIFIMK